jgi:hypothetical protein
MDHQCVRVYNNGDRAVEPRPASRLSEWLEYNKGFRPGTALFVDGVCHQTGYLSEDRCRLIAAELAEKHAAKILAATPTAAKPSLRP